MLKAYTLFLIDDDEDDHLFFQMAAKRLDAVIKCEFAIDDILGLEKLKKPNFKPDIIFVDINMPRMDGIECLQAIKKIEHLKDVPIYMYSTSADGTITQNCIELGATGVVKKFPSVELLHDGILKIFSELMIL